MYSSYIVLCKGILCVLTGSLMMFYFVNLLHVCDLYFLFSFWTLEMHFVYSVYFQRLCCRH